MKRGDNMYYIKKANLEDLLIIESIILEAVAFIKEQGSPQWQDGYHPSNEQITQDIEKGEGFVLIDSANDYLVGYGALTHGPETAYDTLVSGQWLYEEEDYLAIHRIALASGMRGKGLSKELLIGLIREGNRQGYFDFRIDTHPQNVMMDKLVTGIGFKECGEIILPIPNGERIAYQLLNRYY